MIVVRVEEKREMPSNLLQSTVKVPGPPSSVTSTYDRYSDYYYGRRNRATSEEPDCGNRFVNSAGSKAHSR